MGACLFALNEDEILVSSVLSVSTGEFMSVLKWKMVVSSANRVKDKSEEEY